MKKYLILCALLACMAASTSAWAVGIGAYGTGSVYLTSWYFNGLQIGKSREYTYGGGLVIDTNVAKDSLFGYRFTAGYEQHLPADPDSGITGDPNHRFSMTHTFGFGVLRNEHVRLWLGPRFGLHYVYRSDSYWTIKYINYFGYESIQPRKVTVDIDCLTVDVLLAAGINVNIGGPVTLFFDFGFGYMGTHNFNVTEPGHAIGMDARAGVLFRINDTYRAKSPAPVNPEPDTKDETTPEVL